MAFGKRKQRDDNAQDLDNDLEINDLEIDGVEAEPTSEPATDPVVDLDTEDGLEGPFEIEDFDDSEVATVGRLDLGSVLIPTPAAGQVQVELSPAGVPSTVWVVTPNGRFTIAAYAAPKTAGLWREVATELAESLRKDSARVSIETGPWGREVVGAAAGALRFIGVDGYRWMVRCVVNGSHESIAALVVEARNALADTVVRRGDTPLPVRTPLPVQLPEPMAAQLAAAAEQAAQQTPGAPPPPPDVPQPTARRSAQGSAMQQLRTITGG